MNPLTQKERDTLRFLFWFQHRHGYMPSHREVRDAFGFASTNAASCRLFGLIKKDCIEAKPKLSRAIRITEKGMQALGRLDDPWPFFDVEKSA